MSNLWLSDAGKRYALSPKRGMCTDFNAEICQTLTARGQSNDTGSFVSPDIKRVIKSTEIGGVKPVKIETNDGKTFTNEDEEEVARLRIRKLTPKECTRLMGFQDCDYEAMKSVNSDSQIYKQCGNSIVVNVLTAIFGQMFEGKEDIYKNDYER